MFAECPKLTNVKIDCKLLVNGKKMFNKTPITTLDVSSFESVLYGQNMFSGTSLTSFEYDLPSLIDGSYLFSGCSSLTSFSGKLSNVRILDSAFYNNTNFTTFVTDSLDDVESAANAFYKTKMSELENNQRIEMNNFYKLYNNTNANNMSNNTITLNASKTFSRTQSVFRNQNSLSQK